MIMGQKPDYLASRFAMVQKVWRFFDEIYIRNVNAPTGGAVLVKKVHLLMQRPIKIGLLFFIAAYNGYVATVHKKQKSTYVLNVERLLGN